MALACARAAKAEAPGFGAGSRGRDGSPLRGAGLGSVGLREQLAGGHCTERGSHRRVCAYVKVCVPRPAPGVREQESLLPQQAVAFSLELIPLGLKQVRVKRGAPKTLLPMLGKCMLHISDLCVCVFFPSQQPLIWSLLACIQVAQKITSPGKAVGLEM